MKVLVAIKRVIDFNVHIRVKQDKSGVELSNVKMSMNPFCEIAVEQGILLKEAGIASEVVVVSIGAQKSQDTLRTALAMGADRAIHVLTEQEVEPLGVAKILKKIAEQEQAKLVIMGKQSIDGDNNQCGQMLAGLLDWSLGSFVSKVELTEQTATITREIDGGLENLQLQMPSVLTVDLRLNTPRFASLPNIMKAKRKPLDILTIESLEVDIAPRVEVLEVVEPTKRQKGEVLENIEALVNKLKEKKVI